MNPQKESAKMQAFLKGLKIFELLCNTCFMTAVIGEPSFGGMNLPKLANSKAALELRDRNRLHQQRYFHYDRKRET